MRRTPNTWAFDLAAFCEFAGRSASAVFPATLIPLPGTQRTATRMVAYI